MNRRLDGGVRRIAGLVSLVTALSGLPNADAHEASGPPPVPAFDETDPQRYGRALADYLYAFDRGWKDEYSLARMTLIDHRNSSVERRIQQIVLEGEDGDKRVSRFLSPADTKGVAALTHEHPLAVDDTWLYLPASRKVRRISGANRTSSFQGTEFTYEDLTTLDPRRFKWKFVEKVARPGGTSTPIVRLEARPSYANTGYSRLLIELDIERWRIERIVFFDLAGRKLKTMTFTKWKKFHERYWRSLQLEVDNHQTSKRTVLEFDKLLLDLSRYRDKQGNLRKNLSEALFTRRALTHQ